MFGLTAKQLSTISIFIVLMFSKLLTALFPDLFPANELLSYQVWTFAIWLFIMFLPSKIGTAFL